MGLRPARAIRNSKKVAWTRFSRKRPKRSFIKAMPHKDLNVFRMGQQKPDFDTVINLVLHGGDLLLRDNAIESARQAANKYLEKEMIGNYYFVVRIYPHHVIRENKMIAGAGADRLQKGMRMSFGRPTDRAARVHTGTPVFSVYTQRSYFPKVQIALERARRKLSGMYKVEVGPHVGRGDN